MIEILQDFLKAKLLVKPIATCCIALSALERACEHGQVKRLHETLFECKQWSN